MELISIATARTVALFEMQGAYPRGEVSLYDGIMQMKEKYSFSKVPLSDADLDLQKGIDLSFGKVGRINIDKLSFFPNGIVVDTRSSTSDSTTVIQDFLEFVRSSFGATIKPTRWLHLSNIIFRSDGNLSKLHPALEFIASEVGRSVSQDYGQLVDFTTASVAVSADLSKLKLQPASFTFERRSDTPFSANVYFSGAPVGTDKHMQLLTYLESALK